MNAEAQIARRMLHSEKLREVRKRVDAGRAARKKKLKEALEKRGNGGPATGDEDEQRKLEDEGQKLPYSSAAHRYHVAKSQRDHDNIFNWVSSFGSDPALVVRRVSTELHYSLLM